MRFYHDFLFVCRPFDSDSKVIEDQVIGALDVWWHCCST